MKRLEWLQQQIKEVRDIADGLNVTKGTSDPKGISGPKMMFRSAHTGVLVGVSTDRTFWHSEGIDKDYPSNNDAEQREMVRHDDRDANLVASLRLDGLHAPALDMDLPVSLVPSSTEDHFHLLIDHGMPWWKYRILMRVLVFCGLMERRYYMHSVRRGMSMLRLPHILKGESVAERAQRLDWNEDGFDAF